MVGSPLTLASDGRWQQWLEWVRDRGGYLAPRALQPTQEELDAGFFDPEICALGGEELVAQTNDARDFADAWERQDDVDPDAPDERLVSSVEPVPVSSGGVVEDDWYS